MHHKRWRTDLHKHTAFSFCSELVYASRWLQLFLLVKQPVVPVHGELVFLPGGGGHGDGNGSFWIIGGSTVLSEGLECYNSILFTAREGERHPLQSIMMKHIIKTERGLKKS